ncbi:MAG: Dolichol-phosphate mannosyltransferase-like protein [Candidatus Gottesmanbacteria bacterium GW2011_GWA2_44_17]|uniref:Dolichol-phosphate mannosyltransferase-like protein n=1 Tax=Candidatus Gottesmanbacteria bacterium GW2011_GWA2_44_17 TaxID=1618444 RepID=A0A0G1HKU0_9BACT|nr:MAG: Dolichol-phosphate mannosyltransferase-like protein [Candidatus Gottesmanbacteria bacterium GW2011_GWA2_44_17]
MNRPQFELSVILPTFNESENIIPLIEAISKNLREINYEIIICDDNSPDGTGRPGATSSPLWIRILTITLTNSHKCTG